MILEVFDETTGTWKSKTVAETEAVFDEIKKIESLDLISIDYRYACVNIVDTMTSIIVDKVSPVRN